MKVIGADIQKDGMRYAMNENPEIKVFPSGMVRRSYGNGKLTSYQLPKDSKVASVDLDYKWHPSKKRNIEIDNDIFVGKSFIERLKVRRMIKRLLKI